MPLHQLALDDGIRDWVLFPLLIMMILLAMLRHNINKLIGPAQKPQMQKKTFKTIQQAEILSRAARFRLIGTLLHKSAWSNRRELFLSRGGLLDIPEETQSDDPFGALKKSPMFDPSQMMGSLKGSLTMIVPNIFMMSWINYLFSGFVLLRIPLPLTDGFKTMFQRGIDLTTLDVSYVSSISFYFLTLVGLGGLNSILMGEYVQNDTQMMQQQMKGGVAPGMGGGPGQGPPNMFQIFNDEKESIELVEYEWSLKDIEKRILDEN